MSRHGESLSSLWHLSPDMNLPLCRVVAEETFKCRERLPIAAPKVWPHLTISDVNKTHAEIEKYFIFLNAQNGLFNLEGLSQQWLEKQTTAFDEAVAGWFRHDLHTVWRYHAVMEEFLEEVKRLYSDPSGLHEDCEEKILKWVALLLARTPTAILQRMASVAKLYFFTSSIDKRQADGPASLRRTNPNLKCPHASWQRSWELPNLAPLLHESPPLFYPSHNFVSTTSETFRPQGHSPAFHDVFHSTDQSLQESICLRLNEVLSDRDRAALRQEAHNALAWLRTQEVCTWYNAQLNHDKHSFVALLKWIVEEAYRIGQADGGFITLNYVKHWTPLVVDGFMNQSIDLQGTHHNHRVQPFPGCPAARSREPVDPATAFAEELFGAGSARLSVYPSPPPTTAHQMGRRAAMRYRGRFVNRW